ncbi:ABC transporter ATP-binding protein [Agromyces seonyuensis]|uniref:ATP-binding cassette domain-containing protein n=1 Tax=Agromyces seonyuensis TaxID=2662446 RepID=A0A6I4P3J6_9MICO|nr:ABC transporter ATP-binding protein [Agromyces seonyuensis]MWB99415.1 ATP-binding cassette domain-containing protein [Agromyces seonyuensis]
MSEPDASRGLDLDRVEVRAGGRLLLDGVEASVEPGSFTALVGPNGAGKSTLLHAIAGVLTASGGRIAWAGDELAAMRRRDRARTIALAEQQADTELDLTVRQAVLLGRTPYLGPLAAPGPDDREVVGRALADAGASAFADRRFRELSGGERQRVILARALAQEPALLLADEPTNHLDVGAQLAALELLSGLARGGLTVLAALHELNHAAAYADHVIVVADGRVVAAGEPDSILTPEVIDGVYGVRTARSEHPLTGRPLLAFAPATDG